MKRTTRLLSVAFATALLASASGAEPRPFDWIVAVVGGNAISFAEVSERARLLAASQGTSLGSIDSEQAEDYLREALADLEKDALLGEEARRRAILVSPDEVEERAEGLLDRARSRFPSSSDFERALAQEFLTPDALKENFKRQAEGDIYRERLLNQAIRPKILVTPEEIEASYRGRADEVKARHILFRPNEEAQANQALERLKGGESFDRVYREFRGEDLGWFPRGRMVASFEQAAFALAPDQTSELIRSPFGIHIIRCEGRRTINLPPLSGEFRDQIRNELSERKFSEGVEALLVDLRSQVYIREYLDRIPDPDDTLP